MAEKKRSLYNEDQKLRFLNDVYKTDKAMQGVITLMKAIAPFEEKMDADICTCDMDDLRPILNAVCGVREKSRYTRLQIIKRYKRWAVDNHIPCAKILSMNSEDLGALHIQDYLIYNPEHLQTCLNQYFDAESEETTDNIARCFFWLAYGGMSEETIHTVTAKDVDFDRMLVQKGDEVSILYRQGIPAVRNCVYLTQMRYKNQAYVNSGDIYRDRVDGESIFRGVRGTPSKKSLRAMISRKIRTGETEIEKYQQARLTYGHVWLSGVCYRIYEKELAGVEPDFLAIAIESAKGKELIANRSPEEAKPLLLKLAREYRINYSNWKTVIQVI